MKIRKWGKFFGLFCSHQWQYINRYAPSFGGAFYYRWCTACNRFEYVGFMYSWAEDFYGEECAREMRKELNLPDSEDMIDIRKYWEIIDNQS